MSFLEKYKKIFIAMAFLLLILVLGYGMYVLFFTSGREPVTRLPGSQNQQATSTGGLPVSQPGSNQNISGGLTAGLSSEPSGEKILPSQTARGGLTMTTEVSESPSLGSALSADGSSLIYYNKRDGLFYRLAKDGQFSPLTDKVFHEVRKVTWSPDRNKAILEYPDEAKIIYDFKVNKQISLPKHWKDFDFSPDGGKIVLKSMGESADNRWLAVINDEGTDARKIASLGDNDATVYPSWSPNNQTVAMYTEGINFDQQHVFFLGLNDENFKALTIEGRGFRPLWSPDGARLLYSVYASSNNLKPELWLTNARGENIGAGRTKLNVQTWSDKCVFSSSSEIYCAVPENLPEGAGLFPELAKETKDNLYKIDLSTGLKKLIAIPAEKATMSDLIISANGSVLYFTDENTGRINKIKLK